MNIINLLGYVADVKTAAFVKVYAQISFLDNFMFSFFVVPRGVTKEGQRGCNYPGAESL